MKKIKIITNTSDYYYLSDKKRQLSLLQILTWVNTCFFSVGKVSVVLLPLSVVSCT